MEKQQKIKRTDTIHVNSNRHYMPLPFTMANALTQNFYLKKKLWSQGFDFSLLKHKSKIMNITFLVRAMEMV